MAKVNLSQAAKLTGKNRTTIWRHIDSGKLSIERDRDGLPFVDTSELIRVYGELEPIATVDDKKKPHQATPSYEDLIEVIQALRKDQFEMKVQIRELSNRLTYSPIAATLQKSEPLPEDDPDWPKEVRSLADINLRQEIKSKYKK